MIIKIKSKAECIEILKSKFNLSVQYIDQAIPEDGFNNEFEALPTIWGNYIIASGKNAGYSINKDLCDVVAQ